MPSFDALRQKAERGERLNVVFFGGSLTWGANASDPQRTSYRALVADRLLDRFPRAQIRFHDAAIGGTGSQLGMFRLQRDVLAKHPDLVFLDFTANDNIRDADPQTLSSYEWLVRRIIKEGNAVVVAIVLPFKDDAAQGNLSRMPGRDATLKIAQTYNLPAADAVAMAQQRIAAGEFTINALWPWDGAHPCDRGYAVFADTVWSAFEEGLADGRAMRLPAQPLHGNHYRHVERVVLASFGDKLPSGWRIDTPSRVAAWYDGLMTRWLEQVVVAGGKGAQAEPAPLRVTFRGQCVGVFGEETIDSGQYRVVIDGQPVETRKHQPLFSASSARMGGNRQHFVVLATGLDESVEHTLQISPILDAAKHEQLRLESICIAGSQPVSLHLESK